MGRISLTMQMSLDGIITNAHQWMMLNEQIFQDYYEYYTTVDAVIFGGNSYAEAAQHWLHAEHSRNDLERKIATYMNKVQKLVISSSPIDLFWANSRQIELKDDQDVDLLKSEFNKISVESGARTWQLFVQNDLYDELWLLVQPVIVTQGERLFCCSAKHQQLQLTGSKTYDNGVVGLYYHKNLI